MSQIDVSELTKLYYTIGEVADMFGVSKSLIRFWESEFSYLKPHKTGKGERRFTKQNIEQLQLIFHLVKEKGFTLEGARNEIKDNKQKSIARIHTIQTLNALRSKLVDLRNQVDRLDEEE